MLVYKTDVIIQIDYFLVFALDSRYLQILHFCLNIVVSLAQRVLGVPEISWYSALSHQFWCAVFALQLRLVMPSGVQCTNCLIYMTPC